MWKTQKKWPWCPGKCPEKMRNFWSICRMYPHSLFRIFTQQIMCVHPTGAPEISHFFQVIYADTRVFFSGFSAHPWDMYCIFKCVWHVYSGHLPTNLFVYIPQMLWNLCICPQSFTRTLGLCVSGFLHFFWDNYLDTRIIFFGFSAHHQDMYCIFTCVWYIYQGHLPSKLFVYILQMLWIFHIFPRTITRTPGSFYLGFLHIYMSQGCAENPTKTTQVSG